MTRQLRTAGSRAATAAVIGLAAFAALCGGGGGQGRLLLASQGSIVARDVSSGRETLLVAPVGGNGVTLRDPVVSPDGTRLAYVRVTPGAGGTATTELWLASIEGRDTRPSVQAQDVAITHPQWLDAQRLLAVIRSPSRDSAIERISAATGARASLVAGATDFALSRDRALLVYVAGAGGGGPTLYVAAADGSGARVLLSPDQRFASIESPAFSPDGKRVVFAAPEPGAAADTLRDVWSVDVSGGAAARLATLQGAAVSLTFAASGGSLYASAAEGLSVINLRSGTVRRLREPADRSTIAWTR